MCAAPKQNQRLESIFDDGISRMTELSTADSGTERSHKDAKYLAEGMTVIKDIVIKARKAELKKNLALLQGKRNKLSGRRVADKKLFNITDPSVETVAREYIAFINEIAPELEQQLAKLSSWSSPFLHKVISELYSKCIRDIARANEDINEYTLSEISKTEKHKTYQPSLNAPENIRQTITDSIVATVLSEIKEQYLKLKELSYDPQIDKKQIQKFRSSTAKEIKSSISAIKKIGKTKIPEEKIIIDAAISELKDALSMIKSKKFGRNEFSGKLEPNFNLELLKAQLSAEQHNGATTLKGHVINADTGIKKLESKNSKWKFWKNR